ncbi:hypothetical protein [Novosphingobium sp. ERW19]|uniref:hypothetical protein n=1 Tax=Novosphingobium sp. ERW19 TaxID=2726186 RepID=UPI001456D0C1|nr:hypothetical protein [Novosphingobium sp. ERW19]NLR38847.1 hypothetical protein [Novosphingobium sp. ERW19]
MAIDLCTVSVGLWLGLAALFSLIGGCIGYASWVAVQRKFKSPSVPAGLNFSAGCLVPIVFAIAAFFTANALLPDNPCYGAFTADAIFIPPLGFFIVFCSAVTTFWIAAWRR